MLIIQQDKVDSPMISMASELQKSIEDVEEGEIV